VREGFNGVVVVAMQKMVVSSSRFRFVHVVVTKDGGAMVVVTVQKMVVMTFKVSMVTRVSDLEER